jgi:hypothetical protein
MEAEGFVTVVVRHSKTLNLNFVECSGVVTTGQLGALAACAAENPMLLQADGLNVVRPGADLSGVDMAALGALYARYQKLFAPVKVQVYRRTAWVCESPAAMAHVAFWDRGDESRKAFSSNTRRLDTIAEAADWLLLSAAERAQIETGEGFLLIARFDDAPAMPRGLSR